MQQPARTASSLPGRSAALQRALLLTAVAAGLSIPLSLFLHLVAPDLDSIAQRFIAVLVMAALALAATTTTAPGCSAGRSAPLGCSSYPPSWRSSRCSAVSKAWRCPF